MQAPKKGQLPPVLLTSMDSCAAVDQRPRKRRRGRRCVWTQQERNQRGRVFEYRDCGAVRQE